ncbi:hypothetical protein MATL_G00099820 [Megalops atlanticus]|uniref:UEV domain-containing protein n=1 Tax=Megalops atlanticus TaxID=7932 RepID=A0A9D3Q2P2_MEGAT|nr:hypothetical protein MATL_G00099820 [Megalops atlanticus]
MAAMNVGALKKMLPKRYQHRDLIAHEISNVISEYKHLNPAVEPYVFNDGTTKQLISLSGTVPVFFLGKEVNIPVCLWLLDSYPKNPPICFVKPTSEMMILIGQYVDANGELFLPYLKEWSYPQSDLYGLIQVMTVVFGEEPPVCVRPPTQTAPTAAPLNQESQQCAHPESWRQTEVNSSLDEEPYFTLKAGDEQPFSSQNESHC